jgi:AraC-like DNA-binding protein
MNFAASRGASRATLAERSEISPADLVDKDKRIPFAKYVALMRAGQALCHDPALALHFGEAVDPTELSFAAHLGAGSGTLAEGFAQMNRYAPLMIEVDSVGDRFVLTRIDGQLWLIDGRKNPNQFPELTESAFARAVCTVRRIFGEQPALKAVHVTHAAPAYRAEYDRIFQRPVVFDSDKNALLTDESVLSFRSPTPSGHVSEILTAHAEALLDKLKRSKSTRGRVESLLLPALRTGGTDMPVIAGPLGLSRQTLLRQLKAEGVTFKQVLDELRHAMALHYLNGEKASVNETAYRLGFSEPAAFSRAFKRWTGTRPRAVRVQR